MALLAKNSSTEISINSQTTWHCGVHDSVVAGPNHHLAFHRQLPDNAMQVTSGLSILLVSASISGKQFGCLFNNLLPTVEWFHLPVSQIAKLLI